MTASYKLSAKQKIMKKGILGLAVMSLLLAACAKKEEKTEPVVNEDSIKLVALTADYEQATNFNDSLMLLMGDIYVGLDSINMQEGLLYNINEGENPQRREEIRNNLAAIKSRLVTNKKLLAEMEAKVKASGDENSIQAKTISQLKAHIEQQDKKIAQLENELKNSKVQIDSLNTKVAVTEEKVAKTQEELKNETAAKEAAQAATVAVENEANVVYYAMGTNKVLKQKGVLEKKFLGATKVLKGDFDAAFFVKADKRTLKSIPTNSKKVKIWSNMPEGSYQITGEKDGPKTIVITNPEKFWSLASHLVIQID